MSQKSPSSTPAATATAAYCQKACQLVADNLRSLHAAGGETQANSKEKAWFLTVAQELWRHHPGYISTDEKLDPQQEDSNQDENGGNNTNKKKRASDTKQVPVRVRIPCCRECGAGLQPGWHGTTVRVKKRQQKRRRKRQSPASKKLPQKAKQDPLATWRESESTDIQDCRNYLVVMCGSCHCKRRVPGLPNRKSKDPVVDRNQSLTKSKNSSKNDTTDAAAQPQQQQQQSSLDVDLDFVPLGTPQTNNNGSSTATTSIAKKRKGDDGSLLSVPKSTKKKKAPKKKASQLFDFLSSLND